MLIVLLATGSRGDVQPYVALGLALKEIGYNVRVATHENFEGFVKDYGLEFYPLPGDISKIAADENVRKAMEADNPLKVILNFNRKLENGGVKLHRYNMQRSFYQACQGADAIAYHPGAAIGYFIAQSLGIPSIFASPFPMTPTKDFPSLIFYDFIRLGKGFNWGTHKILENIMWKMSSSLIKEFWEEEFGDIPANFTNPFQKQQTKNYPTIISCSNYVFPKPKDWSENVHNTGYWFLDEPDDWNPPAELQKFLDRGNPPIYVGFGSMGNQNPVQTTQLVIDALQASRQRGVLVTGWSGMSKLDKIPDNILIIKSAPHSWLFPRMSAVVHHGGSGTTAAGLRAGVPSILIPHSNDQFAWGRRIYELGVGPKHIPKKQMTVENLSAAIKQAVTPEVKYAAKALGEKISRENGARIAAKLIANCLQER